MCAGYVVGLLRITTCTLQTHDAAQYILFNINWEMWEKGVYENAYTVNPTFLIFSLSIYITSQLHSQIRVFHVDFSHPSVSKSSACNTVVVVVRSCCTATSFPGLLAFFEIRVYVERRSPGDEVCCTEMQFFLNFIGLNCVL